MRLLVILLTFFSSNLSAAVININVSGYVSSVDSVFGDAVQPYELMTGRFSFDPNKVTRITQFEEDRVFHYLPLEFELTLGHFTVKGTGGRAEVSNNFFEGVNLYDRFILETGGAEVYSRNDFLSEFDIANSSTSITFYDNKLNDAITSTSLPSVADILAFDSVPTTSFQINLNDGDFDWKPIFARVTNISVSQVPEPKIGVIVMYSIVIAFFYKSRRKRELFKLYR